MRITWPMMEIRESMVIALRMVPREVRGRLIELATSTGSKDVVWFEQSSFT